MPNIICRKSLQPITFFVTLHLAEKPFYRTVSKGEILYIHYKNKTIMKKILLFLIPFLFAINSYSQEWTEPVQINTLQGLNNNPDFCVDKHGTLHCVWSYKIEQNHRIIYYSKSQDDGMTWSIPENVSQNTSLWMENPHIVTDSENNIHLTYDFNTGNPGGTLIVYRKFVGQNWSKIDTISKDWPGARHNRLVIDQSDKLYCFWFHDYQNGTEFYRVMDYNQWGGIIKVYDNDDSYFLEKAIVDSLNVFHCTGYRFFNDQTSYDQEIVYSTYENLIWSDLTEVSQDYQPWVGNDIALDKELNPHIVWRQTVSNTIPANDGTLYSKLNENGWAYPEIVVEDPSDQAIAIDKNNKVHIVDNEKFENGYRYVHYQLVNNEWVGEIIEEDTYGNFGNIFIAKNNFIYLISGKVHSISPIYNSSIVLRKYEITTSIENNFSPAFNSYTIYPNPSRGNTTISYSLEETTHAEIKIYDLAGKLLKTVLDEKQAPGIYKIMWNGTDKNGKEVNSGLYLIRLQAGRQIITRSVELIK